MRRERRQPMRLAATAASSIGMTIDRRHVSALVWAIFLVLKTGLAIAQGGPPMVTDDPDTPGDGHWEINLASIGSQTFRHWNVDALDADINYGWGDHVQLKLDAPWTYARDAGGDWRSGLGAVNVGVKWRFVDEEEQGFALSTYPQYLSAWSAYSRRHGIASPDQQFFLPLEISTKTGGFEWVGEFGRNFVRGAGDQWELGVVAAHACGNDNLECLLEIHQTEASHDAQTLVNFGAHYQLSRSLILLAAVGREFGRPTLDQQRLLYYFGVQIVR